MFRRGVTLIELLVVLAVAAVLLGLLLPAVQRARSIALRMNCGNNLKQIVLAAHQYHDLNERFPPGCDRSGTPRSYRGWLVTLLPQLEQEGLAEQIAAVYAQYPNPFTSKHDAVRSHVLSVLGCPGDPRVMVAWKVKKLEMSFTSYLGNEGLDHESTGGVLFADSRITIAQITDGTSATLFAGERPPNWNLYYGWWYAGIGQDGRGSGDMMLGARELNASRYDNEIACGPGPFHFGQGEIEDPCSAFHFWSPHNGGANFAFADGSVHFLNYAADSVLPALATRAGGESFEMP